MGLTPGTRLGPYSIGAQIGVGGMGEVYRATDTNLGREVAIKVLPEAFAQDAERLARFEREARTLASLNHPNIAIIHGLERGPAEAGHYVQALVMELVEGPTLADLIERRGGSSDPPMPIDEALPIARQIAEALEAAHEQGIVHRDLKPANVKVRDDGTVKVLDFGLAKMIEDGPAKAGHYGDGRSVRLQPDLSLSPTITTPAMTQLGMILGTAAYMAPEQARGKAVDKRTDIWAFGCVLFEMLTGTRAFDGEDATDTIAAVVRAEPRWDALPTEVPASIRLLLHRCLEKDRKKRIGDISTALFVMREHTLIAPATVSAEATSPERPRSMQRYVVWSALAAIAASLLASTAVWLFMRQDAPRVSRLEIPTSGSSQLALNLQSVHVAITRDGSRLVYVGGPPASGGNIFIRSLDQLGSTLLAENGTHPFVRPDGQWVGFFQTGSLKKVAVTGGPSTELLRTRGALRGATWGPDDTIIFSTLADDSGLLRTSGAGGNPEVLTRPDRARGEADHQWPRFLPGGQAVLFTILSDAGDSASAQVAVLDLRSPGATPRVLIRGGSDARYLPTGHLVYFAGDSLRAVPFDFDRLEVGAGSPMPVLQSVATAGGSGGDFDVADNGTVVYVPAGGGGSPARTLVWVDRQGKEETIPAPPRAYLYPRLSPDGTRVALDVREEEVDIWVWDLLRRNGTRVTTDRGLDRASMWTSDGQHIVFSASRDGTPNVWRQRADGTGTAEQLTKVPLVQFPLSLSPDGTLAIVSQGLGSTAIADLVTVRLDGQGLREAQPLVKTSDGETNGSISPDSRWLAYESNASGSWDVYVRPFPVTDDGARWTVSTDGGTQPRWAPNGRELFYLSPRNEMMRVPVASGSAWSSAARPEKIFDTNAYFAGGAPAPFFNYDIARDGRFLMLKPVAGSTPATLTSSSVIVIQGWFEELKRLVPR